MPCLGGGAETKPVRGFSNSSHHCNGNSSVPEHLELQQSETAAYQQGLLETPVLSRMVGQRRLAYVYRWESATRSNLCDWANTCEHKVGRNVKMLALVGIAGSETAEKAERALSLGNWTAGEDNVQVAPVRKSLTNCLMKPESGGWRTDSGVPITCNTKQQTTNKRYSKPLRLVGSVSKEAGSGRYHLPGVFGNLLAASAQGTSISLPKSPSYFQRRR